MKREWYPYLAALVKLAQLVERWIVIPLVAGSIPVFYPMKYKRKNCGKSSLICDFCSQKIGRGKKYDFCKNDGKAFHLTCNLVLLSSLPVQDLVGKTVMHPIEQWNDIPNWNYYYDTGVIVSSFPSVWNLTAVVIKVNDGSQKPWHLTYHTNNVWGRP